MIIGDLLDWTFYPFIQLVLQGSKQGIINKELKYVLKYSQIYKKNHGWMIIRALSDMDTNFGTHFYCQNFTNLMDL